MKQFAHGPVPSPPWEDLLNLQVKAHLLGLRKDLRALRGEMKPLAERVKKMQSRCRQLEEAISEGEAELIHRGLKP